MLKVFAPLAALMLSALFFFIGFGAVGTMVPLRASIEGFGGSAVGLLASAIFFGSFIGARLAINFIRRASYIRTFAAAASLAAACVLGLQLILHPLAWLMICVLFGALSSVGFVIFEGWINSVTTKETRGGIFGAYIALSYLGLGLGQAILAKALESPVVAFSLAAGAMILSVAPVCLTRFSEPQGAADIRVISFLEAYKLSPLACMASVIAGLIFGCDSLFIVYGADIGLEASKLAILAAAIKLSGLVLQIPIGYLSDRVRDRRSVMMGVMAAAAGLSILLFFSDNYPWMLLLALTFIYGGIVKPLYPLAVAYGNDFISKEKFAPFISKIIQYYFIGAFIGPAMVGAIMEVASSSWLFIMLTAFSLMLLAITASGKFMPKVVPLETEKFVPTAEPASVANLADIDPRGAPVYTALDIGPPAPEAAVAAEEVGPPPPPGDDEDSERN